MILIASRRIRGLMILSVKADEGDGIRLLLLGKQVGRGRCSKHEK